jgi:hypothetical protein
MRLLIALAAGSLLLSAGCHHKKKSKTPEPAPAPLIVDPYPDPPPPVQGPAP